MPSKKDDLERIRAAEKAGPGSPLDHKLAADVRRETKKISHLDPLLIPCPGRMTNRTCGYEWIVSRRVIGRVLNCRNPLCLTSWRYTADGKGGFSLTYLGHFHSEAERDAQIKKMADGEATRQAVMNRVREHPWVAELRRRASGIIRPN